MKELVLLIKNHYEAILFVLAFEISMINLIYLVFTNKKEYFLKRKIILQQKFIAMYELKMFENEIIKIIIMTNRNKIKKKINIRKYYLTSTKFMDDASKYYNKKKDK